MSTFANLMKLGVGLFSTGLLASAMLLAACSAETWEPPIPQGAGISSWFDNGAGGQYVLNVVAGQLPEIGAQGARAVVLSDTNCAPDAQGLNHCHNVLAFRDGHRVEVINNHQMAVHRCLAPGETVTVAALNEKWVVLRTNG